MTENDRDHFLDAEELIVEISHELQTLRSTILVLEDTQHKIDTVLKVSENTIVKTGEFIKHGKTIVENLDKYDYSQEVEKLVTNAETIVEYVKSSGTKIEKSVEKAYKLLNTIDATTLTLTQRVSDLVKAHKALTNKLDSVSKNFGKDLASMDRRLRKHSDNWMSDLRSYFGESNKKLQNYGLVMLVVVMGTILIGFSLLLYLVSQQ